MVANEEQVGGAHYKGKRIEHWDFILMHDIPYMEAQIIKYMMRWRDKNGVEDLRKAKHFVEKLIEHELEKQTEIPTETSKENLAKARAAIHGSKKDVDKYMNPNSGVPRGKGYVDQD